MTVRFKQTGAALIVGLIFLLILTIFVLASMRDILLQERMAGAYRNASQADAAVLSNVRNAESLIFNTMIQTNDPLFRGTALGSGLKALGDADAIRFREEVKGFDLTPVTQYFTPTRSYQVISDDRNKLASSGAYVIEGPFRVLQDDGYGAAASFKATGGGVILESHTGNAGSGGCTGGQTYLYRISARAVGGTTDFVRAKETSFTVTCQG